MSEVGAFVWESWESLLSKYNLSFKSETSRRSSNRISQESLSIADTLYLHKNYVTLKLLNNDNESIWRPSLRNDDITSQWIFKVFKVPDTIFRWDNTFLHWYWKRGHKHRLQRRQTRFCFSVVNTTVHKRYINLSSESEISQNDDLLCALCVPRADRAAITGKSLFCLVDVKKKERDFRRRDSCDDSEDHHRLAMRFYGTNLIVVCEVQDFVISSFLFLFFHSLLFLHPPRRLRTTHNKQWTH